jgi:hypothetical protein
MLAGAMKKEGYEVTPTPRSGDHGRDVIAVKPGIGCLSAKDTLAVFGLNVGGCIGIAVSPKHKSPPAGLLAGFLICAALGRPVVNPLTLLLVAAAAVA